MSSQTGIDRFDWRRAIGAAMASGALAAAVVTGAAAPSAFAQPTQPAQPSVTETPTPEADGPRTPCTGEDCSKPDEPAEPTADAAGPVAPCTGEDCNRVEEVGPKKMSADEALTIIQNEYAQGDGGGQISKLIDDAVNLRRLGFRPSNANAEALANALEDRPHQTPLVEALKETLAYQRKLQAQAAMAGDDGSNGGPPITIGPNVGVTVPLG